MSEQAKARQEACCNASETEYFGARSQIDTLMQRHSFCAGFYRGYAAALAAAPAQERIDALELEVRQLTEQIARLRHAPAPQADSQPAPVMEDTPPPCDQELFDQGVSVGLFDIPKWTAEELCRGIAAATEARVDWHYLGGHVHIKALPAARAQAQAGAVPLTDEQIDQAIAELGLNYLADAHATNRAVLRKLCHHAHGIKGGQHDF
jgi:hypothetical protein